MASARPFIAGTVVAAIATAQGLPSIRWREADCHGIGSCRMVFDVARNRFVAHGALGAAQPYLTVEWDGRRWEARRTSAAPPIRAGFGLAYDVGRSRVVLFGGSRNASNSTLQLLNDLWEYDGLDWVDRNPAVRPPARQLLAMAYDFAGGRVLMTGGSAELSPALTDTWAWNGSAWQQLAATSPPLAYPEMASHVSTQRVVLVGLRANGSGETWTFDGTSWNPAAAGVVPAAQSYRMATDIANDCVVLLAGDSATPLEWHGSTWTPRPTTFDGRRDCGFAADGAGRVLAFAGQQFMPALFVGVLAPLNDTWVLDATGATKLADGGPRNQLEVQVAYDLPRNRIVCVGARGNAPTSEHDGTSWRVTTAATPPVALGTRLCHDLLRGRTLRFGGYRLNGLQIVPNDELSEWDGAQWNVLSTTSRPAPRWHHAMAFDLPHGAILLFGGLGQGNVLLGDTWQWDGAHWTLIATTGPAPRSQAAMTFDLLRTRAVLFGGLIQSAGNLQATGDTWEWDGTSWLQRLVFAPSSRYDAVIDYDLAHQRTVLLGGGNTARQFDDMWTWDGSIWLQLPGNLPSNGMRRVGALRGDGSWLLVALGTDWVGAPSVAAVSVVGTACGGATLPVLRAFGDPAVASNSFAAELHHAGANAPFLFAIGAGTANAPIGAGCTVYLPQIDEARVGFAGATGFAAVALPVPNAPQLIGLEVSLQAGVLDATAPLGFALTNAVVARLGM